MRTVKRGDREWAVVLIHGAYYLQHGYDDPIGPFFSLGQIQEWAGDSQPDGKDDNANKQKPTG